MKSAASPAWPAKRMTKVLADFGRFGGVEGGRLCHRNRYCTSKLTVLRGV